jgi:hypothetical protein
MLRRHSERLQRIFRINTILKCKVYIQNFCRNRDYGRRGSAALTMRLFYPQKLVLTSPTSGGLAVGIVRSRTKATELVSLCRIMQLLKQRHSTLRDFEYLYVTAASRSSLSM